MNNVNDILARLGLNKNNAFAKMMDREGLAVGRENLSTLREMLRLMEKLYRREDLSFWVYEKTLEMLKKPKEGLIEGVIRNAVPNSIEIADKSGWVDGAICDIGIVFLEKRPYIIALMAKYTLIIDTRHLATIKALTEITVLAYNYFYEVSISTPFGRRKKI